MKINKILLQGFRSFAGQQEIEYSKLKPGLYHVTGRNLVEPSLEANGAGKSTLLQAPFWAAFGKLTSGLRAAAVKNWNSKEQCAVIMEGDTATGEQFALFRSWSPNALELDLTGQGAKPVDQESLEAVLGWTPEAFQYAIFFAQFEPAFVDLRASEQAEVFSSALGLAVWDVAADRAGKQAADLENGAQRHEQDLARMQGQAAELLATDYEAQEKEWEAAHHVRVVFAMEKQRDLAHAYAMASRAAEAGDGRAGKYHEAVAARDRHDSIVALKGREIMAAESQLVGLGDTKGVCPSCGAPMSRPHVDLEKAKINRVIIFLRAEIKRLDAVRYALQAKVDKHKDEAAQAMTLISGAAVAAERLNVADEAVRKAEQEVNPYTAPRLAAELRGQKMAEAMGAAQKAFDTALRDAAAARFWVKGFREIRLGLIQKSLAQLTVETNEELFGLGLHDWSIEFDVERETKSGSINKNFTIAVRAPHTDFAVPWAAWSGGEAQRLRLATIMGFANLICSRRGTKPNIECWDEPTQGLSKLGIQDLLSVLANRAQKHQKVILLADHRAMDFGGFAGTIEVVKDKDGSHINMGDR